MTFTTGSGSARVNTTRLGIGMLIALVGSLSVHVVMLQVLRIPFPEFDAVKPWVPFLNTGLTVLSLIVFYSLARPRLVRFRLAVQCVIVFLLYVMLRESFRGMFMSGFVTRNWAFDAVAGLQGLAYSLLLAAIVVLIAPQLRAMWIKVTGAAAITAFVSFALKPLLHIAFAPALRAITPLDHADLYTFPYGWHVLLPAYITYSEPVVAAVFIAALVWQALSSRFWVRVSQFVLLILLMRGMLLPTFLYSFYSKLPLRAAMLSQSQFLFETIALGVLVAIAWQVSIKNSSLKDSKEKPLSPQAGEIALDTAST